MASNDEPDQRLMGSRVTRQKQKRNQANAAVSLAVKAVVITFAIVVLSRLFPKLIALGNLRITGSTFASLVFLIDFIVILLIVSLYDLIVERSDRLYQELGGAFLGAFTLAIYPPTISVVLLSVILFIAFLIAFIAGLIIQRSGVLRFIAMFGVFLLAANLVINHLSVGPTGGIGIFNLTAPGHSVSQSALINYTLSQINMDRAQYGLSNVTLSSEPSAQQHADSMLQYGYFSHWDVFGLKPYMRYTLEGGNGSVSENVAYQYYSLGINPEQAVEEMEYSMMYNDSACCNNGHRDNILNPYHNQVSIGVAYSGTTVYLVEDFIDSYVTWFNDTPAYSNGEVYLFGNTTQAYTVDSVQISYDPTVSSMSVAQLDNTSDYSYGPIIAGVVSNPAYYYQNITTIDADTYQTFQDKFRIAFNMSSLIGKEGAGEYTIELWFKPASGGSDFVGSTFTIFVNSQGQVYRPANV